MNDQTLLLSQYCSGLYPQLQPEGESRPRRRRRKAKEEAVAAGGSGSKKRQLSKEQVKFLEMNFGSEHKLQSERKARLASESGLDPRQVAVWFQNRRARWKSKQLEDDYERVKSLYDAVSVEKCRLEIEVMELKKKLSEAESEIVKLTAWFNGGEKSCSTTSSFSINATQAYTGKFEIEENENFMCNIPENININGLEWFNFYPM